MSEFETEMKSTDVAATPTHELPSGASKRDETAAIKEAYLNEPVRCSSLQIVDLAAEGAGGDETDRNQVIYQINDSYLRLTVFNEEYHWHYHPTSDELLIVVDGCLAIDLAEGREFLLSPWQSITIPRSVVHRTRAIGRTVNLCFEQAAAETVFTEKRC